MFGRLSRGGRGRTSYPIRTGTRKLRMAILVVSIVSGGAAALIARNTGAEAPAPVMVVEEAAPEPRLAEVLVAASDLERGTSIGAETVRWQAWPRDAIGAGYISRGSRPDATDVLAGHLVRSRFVAGEPILETKLGAPGTGSLSAMLAPGKRAVAVRVTAETTAGGFILPNDRVDVVHSITRNGQGGQQETISRTVLSNVRVLAIDQTQVLDPDASKTAVLGRTATLELDVGQVETLAAAEMSGVLSLALRSIADGATPEAPVLAQREKPVDVVVRVHRGGAVETFQLPDRAIR